MTDNIQNFNANVYTSDSDDEAYDQLNVNKIEYNRYVMEGMEVFHKRDFTKAIKNYENCLKLVIQSQDIEKICSAKCNLAIVYFYSNDFKKALTLLEECVDMIKNYQLKNILTENQKSLFVRILGNLCVLNLFMNKFEEAKINSNEIITIINSLKDSMKKPMLEELIYVLFRFKSFESLGEGYFENLETKYDGETLGCLYLILGLNRELVNDSQLAIIYYKKSFDVWRNLNDRLFLILSCKHIIYLSQQINQHSDFMEYTNILNNLFANEDLKNISPDLLFKDFEKRLMTAKDITAALKKLEENNLTTIKQETFKKSYSQKQLEEINSLGEPLWKQAVRLKLFDSIKSAQSLSKSSKDPKEQEQLGYAVVQMQKTLEMIQNERNPLIDSRVQNDVFTKDAVILLKSKLDILKKFILRHSYTDPWSKLVFNRDKKSRLSELAHRRNIPSPFVLHAEQTIRQGEMLTKINYGSNGKKVKFFKLCEDNVLRWGSSESDLKKPNKKHTVYLNDIKAVVYGKKSDNLSKASNKQLLPWLCLTIKLQTRTLDLYLKPDQINTWAVGLSYIVKKHNSKAECMRPGKIIWRKFRLLALHKISEHMVGKDKKKIMNFESLVKAISALKKSIIANQSVAKK